MGKFEKNHFFPNYNLKYWKKIGSKLYDKADDKDRNFNPANTFYLHKYYYFDGSAELEIRLGKIENQMSEILKKISASSGENNIKLSEYEINFIQLFLFLQAYRQLFTTEVIKDDQSGLYKSNDYLFGVFNIKNRDEMQTKMYSLVDALENIMREENSKNLAQWMRVVFNTHLVIAKNSDSQICQSDSCCIIRNDMYSNHLYTYFPQTPSLAFFLVNTKYFLQEKNISNYLAENGNKYICSILLDSSKHLVCQYDKPGFVEQTESDFSLNKPITNFQELKTKEIPLSLVELSKNEIDSYNSILLDDGEKFIHPQDSDYIPYLQSLLTNYRTIKIHHMLINNTLPFFPQPFLAYNPDRKVIQSDQLCKTVQDLSISPMDVIFVNILRTKKGSVEEENVKKELIFWLDNMQGQNNFSKESILFNQGSTSDDQTIKSVKVELTKGLSKSEIGQLKWCIENFDQIESQNLINNNLEREEALKWFFDLAKFKNVKDRIIDQESLRPLSSNLLSSEQNKKEEKQDTEKNSDSDLEGISWASGFKKKNKGKIEKVNNLKSQSQNNLNQILDEYEPQPGSSGLTREDLQRIQRRQEEKLKGLEESEMEL